MSLDRITHPLDRPSAGRQVRKAKQPMEPSRYTSLEQAAVWYGVSQRTIRRAINEGALPAVRVGRQIRIAWSDLEAFAQPVAVTDEEA